MTSGVEEPVNRLREGGIVLAGNCRHLVFRNFIVKNFLNDGYNLHGNCRRIAEKRAELFAVFDGNLEKAIR